MPSEMIMYDLSRVTNTHIERERQTEADKPMAIGKML